MVFISQSVSFCFFVPFFLMLFFIIIFIYSMQQNLAKYKSNNLYMLTEFQSKLKKYKSRFNFFNFLFINQNIYTINESNSFHLEFIILQKNLTESSHITKDQSFIIILLTKTLVCLTKLLLQINTYYSHKLKLTIIFFIDNQFFSTTKKYQQVTIQNMVKHQSDSQFKNSDGYSGDPDYRYEKGRRGAAKISKNKKKQNKKKELTSRKQNSQQKKEQVRYPGLHEEIDDLSDIDRQINNGSQNNPNGASQNNSSSQKCSDQFDEDDIMDIRMFFVEWLNSINQHNGLVFKKQFRKRFEKLWPKNKYPFITLTPEHDLDPQGAEQIQKIRIQIQKLVIFMRNHHDIQSSEEEFRDYISKDLQAITKLFKEASYIFCKQVTHELYSILRKLCNIAIEFRSRQKNQKFQNEELIRQLRHFGDQIASQTNNQHKYFFFGYQFIKFQDDMTVAEMEKQSKKDKYKYALLPKYRMPDTQYANFTEKLGLFLLEQMSNLECYNTLN